MLMNAQNIIMTAAWTLLVLSWIIPIFVKDKRKATFIGVILSGISLGMFIADSIYSVYQ